MYARALLILTLLFTSTFEALPSAAAADCATTFGRLTRWLSVAGKPTVFDTETKELHPTVRRWLRLRQTEIKVRNYSDRNVGDIIHIRTNGAESIDCRIVATLGQGYEGITYLVKTPDGFRTLKFFRNADQLNLNLRQFEAKNALPKPTIHAVDRSITAVLFDYIEGIPLSVIRSPSQWAKVGLSRKQRDQILTQWRIAHQSNPSIAIDELKPDDVIYSLQHHTFHMIDPH